MNSFSLEDSRNLDQVQGNKVVDGVISCEELLFFQKAGIELFV